MPFKFPFRTFYIEIIISNSLILYNTPPKTNTKIVHYLYLVVAKGLQYSYKKSEFIE